MPIPVLPNIQGHSLDGGLYTIDAKQNRLLCESLSVAPDPSGYAHPVYFYIATQVGMGLTVPELCSLCNFDIDDGPMLGSCDLRIFDPLRIGEPYQVRGEVIGLARKNSRKLGIMDVLQYSLHLDRGSGARACSVTNIWILPRGYESDN